MTHDDVQELLEAYALSALADAERRQVDRHLTECPICAADAAAWQRVVDAIPETVGERSPSPALRERILSLARSDVVPRRARALPHPNAGWLAAAVFLFVAAASLVAAGGLRAELEKARAEAAALADIAEKVSQGGRWWYMIGTEGFSPSGGTLIEPRRDARSFVLFHDLRALEAGSRYTIWLISETGSWVRAASFRPSGEHLQRVDVPLPVSEFVRCAVTVETATSGPPKGPLAMQSRVFGQ